MTQPGLSMEKMVHVDVFVCSSSRKSSVKGKSGILTQHEPGTFYCTSSANSVYKHWQKDELTYKNETTYLLKKVLTKYEMT